MRAHMIVRTHKRTLIIWFKEGKNITITSCTLVYVFAQILQFSYFIGRMHRSTSHRRYKCNSIEYESLNGNSNEHDGLLKGDTLHFNLFLFRKMHSPFSFSFSPSLCPLFYSSIKRVASLLQSEWIDQAIASDMWTMESHFFSFDLWVFVCVCVFAIAYYDCIHCFLSVWQKNLN